MTILNKEPHFGRPKKYGETTKTVTVRLPESTYNKIPKPKSIWIREKIMELLKKDKEK